VAYFHFNLMKLKKQPFFQNVDGKMSHFKCQGDHGPLHPPSDARESVKTI